jgi:hypothetical protein
MFAFSDGVFRVNESSTDYHVTFAEHLSINKRNVTDYTCRVTQGLVTFEIKGCSNGSDTVNNSYVCVSIQIITSQQENIRLWTFFSIKNLHGDWIELDDMVSTLSVNNTQMYNLILPNNVTNETSEVVVDGDILSIAMHGSYIIHGQHTTTTSHAKFNPETYASFNMEYTWTVCNLTLLNSNDADRYIASDKLFTKLDGAEFYLYIKMDEEDNSVYILRNVDNEASS